jgi:hypothetical protein
MVVGAPDFVRSVSGASLRCRFDGSGEVTVVASSSLPRLTLVGLEFCCVLDIVRFEADEGDSLSG